MPLHGCFVSVFLPGRQKNERASYLENWNSEEKKSCPLQILIIENFSWHQAAPCLLRSVFLMNASDAYFVLTLDHRVLVMR